jgi:hypothetical protein
MNVFHLQYRNEHVDKTIATFTAGDTVGWSDELVAQLAPGYEIEVYEAIE